MVSKRGKTFKTFSAFIMFLVSGGKNQLLNQNKSNVCEGGGASRVLVFADLA
jgi:hypothetical protein